MTERDATATLLALYSEAAPDTVMRGRRWYSRMRRECRKIAADTGYSLAQVAAVAAITSPDAQLVQNIRWTRAACESRGTAKVGRYPNQQVSKIRAVLASSRPGRHVSGPKVSAFYRAILGDSDALVVDRWAAYAAGHPSSKIGPRERRVIEDAYRRASAAVGESVAAFQAIIWEHIRAQAVAIRGGRTVQVRYSNV